MTNPFKTQYQKFIAAKSYCRWNAKEGRRETWSEAVQRYGDYLIQASFVDEMFCTEYETRLDEALGAVEALKVMPSMRLLWTAGAAVERENVSAYNCAYRTISDPKAFAEVLYVLMCGAGVGVSVERQVINKLPTVPEHLWNSDKVITFRDSKRGWAEGYHQLITSLYKGDIPSLDYSKIRPKGSKLKTFGGRASGPEPLEFACKYTLNLFNGAKGRKLTSEECADLCCIIANCVVSGGVRRSAIIVLCNLSDQRMRHYKSGEWWKTHPHRAYANISVAYTEKPPADQFLEEWLALMRNGSGERGVVNREGLVYTSGRNLKENPGVNPCGEIALRDKQFCNLTEVVVEESDKLSDLKEKVKYATILGTLQSTLTDFKFLGKEWKDNCDEERLLGVSLTGAQDHPVLSWCADKDNHISRRRWLDELAEVAYQVNRNWADALGISMSAGITCVKPSGTVSQLVGTASGLHPRHSAHYIRRVRMDNMDPLTQYMKDKGVPWEPETGESRENHKLAVFEFPVKSPSSSTFRQELSAIEQLNYWKEFKLSWCDHNPSVTIYIREHEWVAVADWVYHNWQLIGGLSFLPYDGGTYPLMPFEECSEEEWARRCAEMPSLDFEQELAAYELEDKTEGAKEFACTGGACELK
nr:adenosylcobalamin-dependent ribonucleoside-triphosphate reductase [Deltaproteobacteria bacterium]